MARFFAEDCPVSDRNIQCHSCNFIIIRKGRNSCNFWWLLTMVWFLNNSCWSLYWLSPNINYHSIKLLGIVKMIWIPSMEFKHNNSWGLQTGYRWKMQDVKFCLPTCFLSICCLHWFMEFSEIEIKIVATLYT